MIRFFKLILLLGFCFLGKYALAVEDLTIIQDDNYPYYYGQFVTSTGVVDLTGTTISVMMSLTTNDISNTTTAKINMAPATVLSAKNGLFMYVWSGSDTDTVGIYNIRFVVQKNGVKFTKPTTEIARVIVKD